MEQLLSQEEIKFVLRQAKDPFLRMPGVIGKMANGNPLTIASITPKGLIFIYGNEHTGLEHIMDRHGYFSNRADWYVSQEGKHEIDNPSKFSNDSSPLPDYSAIVDEIYSHKNLAESKRPELFEKYTGFSSRLQNTEQQYNLLVYSGTKIVHSLFPQKKQFNKRQKIINFKKGELIVEEKMFDKRFLIAKFPYTDVKNIIRYMVIIRLDNKTRILKTYVQINNVYGHPLYSEPLAQTILAKEMTAEEYFYSIENVDLSKVEKAIKKFHKHVFKE